MRIIVIGAGLGGLAAAIRLASRGHRVAILERRSTPGGKVASRMIQGYRFDSGPSLITMPDVFRDLFAASGARLEDYIDLIAVNPACRYFWDSGTVLDASADQKCFARDMQAATGEAPAHLYAFRRYSARIYRVAAEIFMRHDLRSLHTLRAPRFLRSLVRIGSIDPLRSMHRAVGSFFVTAEMRQFFDRYATYNGSSPYRAPATLNLIGHVEQSGGAFYARNGMYTIATALARRAVECGVEMRWNSAVDRIIWANGGNYSAGERDGGRHGIKGRGGNGRRSRAGRAVVGVEIDGALEPADAIIANVDVGSVYRQLLRDRDAPDFLRYRRHTPSSSALVFLWGINRCFDRLLLHNILFSGNYRREFDAIFEHGRCPAEPTLYINIGAKMNSADAPPGCENWFVMLNVPPDCGQDWQGEAQRLRAQIIRRLNSLLKSDLGGGSLADHIVAEELITPADIARDTASAGGSLYGIASNGIGAAFRRHPNRSRYYRGLYFCGGSAHPGGGMPLVLLSAEIVANAVERHC